MKKPVDLERLERNYWGYDVRPNPKGGFLVRNLHNSSLPQGLTLCLPAEMDIAMDGEYLDPARFIPDRYEILAENLWLGVFGGTMTSVMFCDFDEESKYITPMDPLEAPYVIVRVKWNLSVDAEQQGTQSIDPITSVEVVYEWHDTDISRMRGWDLLIIRLDEALEPVHRQIFSDELAKIVKLHDAEMQKFEQEKAFYRAKFAALESRARAAGWKMKFGDEDSDWVEITHKDDRGIHSVEYRYNEPYLADFQSALVRQEAWDTRMSAPKRMM